MADMMKKVPVREQEPKVRATNFEEVCLGYNKEEAMEEATRCLNCKNARCIQGCPVSINIPAFIQEVKAGNIEEAYKVIGKSSALPAICGRVCPQESQCEGKCVRGIKGEAMDYEVSPIKIHFGDGLPNDELEQATIYSTRLAGMPTISQKSAMMKLDGLSSEQADAEIERMKEEQAAAMGSVDASVFNETSTNTGTNNSTDTSTNTEGKVV